MKGKHAIFLLVLPACIGCLPEKKQPHTDIPQDTVPVFVDTTGVTARVEAMYSQTFDLLNLGERVDNRDTCFTLRLKELWESLPENELIYDADIWTNLQDYDYLVYQGDTLEQVVMDTAWMTIHYRAFRDDTRTARIRAVRELQQGNRTWFIDDITFLEPGPSYSISDIAEYHLPDSNVWFHWDSGPYNTHEADNVIRLCFWHGLLVDGYFWGTSDEFYDAREGFNPGHTLLRMHRLSMNGDTLSFFLDSRGIQYLNHPAPLNLRSTDKALKLGAQPWLRDDYYAFFDSIQYRALLKPDTLLLLRDKSHCPYREDHPFRHCTAEEVLMLYPDTLNHLQYQPEGSPTDSLREDSVK